MTSAILSAAEAALALDEVVDEASRGEEGSLNGRKATHWSYKVFIAGSIIGAIAAVACYILDMHAISFFGALLALTNGFAAFYVKKFGILKTLENYTGRLAEKVSDLKEVNQGLNQVNDGLQEVPDNWRKEIQRGKRDLERKTRKLQELSAKLEAAEKKLQTLAGLTTKIQKKTIELSVAAVKFSEENKLYGDSVDRLASEVAKVEEYQSELADIILKTDAGTDEYEKLNEQFTRQLEMLDDLFELMKKLYLNAQKRMLDLEAQVDELGEVIPKAVQSAEDAVAVRREMEKLHEDYEHVLSKLEEALHSVKRYKKYKKGYIELRELKKSVKWPEIERLLKT